MNDGILISFIVPVYNVEPYINQCITSIAQQITDGIEIILIDDGSNDRSGEICDELAEIFTNITVIHQKNAGHSAARNFGLTCAKGRYVTFVDSDDFIEEHCISKIINWIDNNDEDLCLMNTFKFFNDGSLQILDVFPDRCKIKDVAADKAISAIAATEKFPGSACGKLFKREFIINNDIKFPIDLLHGEDLTFMIKCYAYASSIDYLDINYYFYRQGRRGSITSCVDKTQTYIDLSKFVVNTVQLSEFFPEKIDSIRSFAAYEYLIVLSTYCQLKGELKKNAKEFFLEYKWILKYGTSKKIRILRSIVDIWGFKITSSLMRTWMNIRKICRWLI